VIDDFARRAANDRHPNLQLSCSDAYWPGKSGRSASATPFWNVASRRCWSGRCGNTRTNRSLTAAAEGFGELVKMAKALKAEHDRGAKLGLRDDERPSMTRSARTTRP
jgi:hypothetical protein